MSDDESTEVEAMAETGGGKPEKSMADRALEIGRDGAYLEVDAKDLVEAHRCGELQKASIVVVRAARIELSSGDDVSRLLSSVAAARGRIDNSAPCVAGMSDEQVSAGVVRDAFVAGLATTQAAG
jgi:hypothetical protein